MRIIEQDLMSALLLILAALYMGAASAHGGAGGGPSCALRLGAWRLDVALYQPATRDGEMFCDALPAAGASVISFDVVDAALAAMPVEVRIVRAGYDTTDAINTAWDTPAFEAATVAYLPAATHADGTVLLRHEFTAAGPYLALLRTSSPKGGEWRGVFRFTVGTATMRMQQAATVVLGALAAFALLAVARRATAMGDTGNNAMRISA